MVSTTSPVYSPEPVLANYPLAYETGFTPWEDSSDLFSIFDLPVCSVEVNPGLVKANPCQITPGSEHKPLNRTGSDLFVTDQENRRMKRKLSNRESARRSRLKKQKYLEDMRNKLNQLKTESRELENRLRYVLYQFQLVITENDRLRLEHRVLHEKLLNIREALMQRQAQQSLTCSTTWPFRNSTVVTVQQNPYNVI